MKRRMTALLIALLTLALSASTAGAAQEEAMTAEEAMLAFRAFSREAAGKYVLRQEEDTVVLELTPAMIWGRATGLVFAVFSGMAE